MRIIFTSRRGRNKIKGRWRGEKRGRVPGRRRRGLRGTERGRRRDTGRGRETNSVVRWIIRGVLRVYHGTGHVRGREKSEKDERRAENRKIYLR